jgi:hypothetical protein
MRAQLGGIPHRRCYQLLVELDRVRETGENDEAGRHRGRQHRAPVVLGNHVSSFLMRDGNSIPGRQRTRASAADITRSGEQRGFVARSGSFARGRLTTPARCRDESC